VEEVLLTSEPPTEVLLTSEPPTEVQLTSEPPPTEAAPPGPVQLPALVGRTNKRAGFTKNKGKGQSKVRRRMAKQSRRQNRKA
jgi:hypothetical protein